MQTAMHMYDNQNKYLKKFEDEWQSVRPVATHNELGRPSGVNSVSPLPALTSGSEQECAQGTDCASL